MKMDNWSATGRRIMYSLIRFNRHTWRSIEYFDSGWKKRIEAMAQYISPGKSVLDLGCGKMWLKDYLRKSKYYPVDYKSRGKDTIVCNFNEKEFPKQHADVAFVSGALEYVTDASWFVSSIATHCKECVISYCLQEYYPDPAFRRRQAWMNNYSRAEIIKMFRTAGFTLQAENKTIPKNRIFYFVKSAS